MAISEVKLYYMVVGEKLIPKLNNRFPTCELMDSLGVVYPQFRLSLNVDGYFQHLNVIKYVYCVPKKHGFPRSGLWIPLMLDPTTLDMQRSLFVLTMKNNCHVVMVEPHNHNPLTRLWK
jgi:hypothetical protein